MAVSLPRAKIENVLPLSIYSPHSKIMKLVGDDGCSVSVFTGSDSSYRPVGEDGVSEGTTVFIPPNKPNSSSVRRMSGL